MLPANFLSPSHMLFNGEPLVDFDAPYLPIMDAVAGFDLVRTDQDTQLQPRTHLQATLQMHVHQNFAGYCGWSCANNSNGQVVQQQIVNQEHSGHTFTLYPEQQILDPGIISMYHACNNQSSCCSIRDDHTGPPLMFNGASGSDMGYRQSDIDHSWAYGAGHHYQQLPMASGQSGQVNNYNQHQPIHPPQEYWNGQSNPVLQCPRDQMTTYPFGQPHTSTETHQLGFAGDRQSNWNLTPRTQPLTVYNQQDKIIPEPSQLRWPIYHQPNAFASYDQQFHGVQEHNMSHVQSQMDPGSSNDQTRRFPNHRLCDVSGAGVNASEGTSHNNTENHHISMMPGNNRQPMSVQGNLKRKATQTLVPRAPATHRIVPNEEESPLIEEPLVPKIVRKKLVPTCYPAGDGEVPGPSTSNAQVVPKSNSKPRPNNWGLRYQPLGAESMKASKLYWERKKRKLIELDEDIEANKMGANEYSQKLVPALQEIVQQLRMNPAVQLEYQGMHNLNQ